MCNERKEHFVAERQGMTSGEIAAIGEPVSGGELAEAIVRIITNDGVADAFLVHPAKDKHPGVVTWPDIAGVRESMKIMARRLARRGYAVLLVNQYYRSAPAPVFNHFSEWRAPEGQRKAEPMVNLLTPEAIKRDAKAFVTYLDAEDAVDRARKIGTSGYCLGASFAVRTAAAVPDRIGAAVSFHGAHLVTTGPDSPHQLLGETKASFIFAIGRNDHNSAPDEREELREAAEAAGRPVAIEVYPADHGWCVLDTPLYDQVQADRVWGELLELFGSTL